MAEKHRPDGPGAGDGTDRAAVGAGPLPDGVAADAAGVRPRAWPVASSSGLGDYVATIRKVGRLRSLLFPLAGTIVTGAISVLSIIAVASAGSGPNDTYVNGTAINGAPGLLVFVLLLTLVFLAWLVIGIRGLGHVVYVFTGGFIHYRGPHRITAHPWQAILRVRVIDDSPGVSTKYQYFSTVLPVTGFGTPGYVQFGAGWPGIEFLYDEYQRSRPAP